VNYSWLHVNSANHDYQRTGSGGSGYFEYNLNRTVGLVADFGGYANTRTGINDRLLTYMFGPRFGCFELSSSRSSYRSTVPKSNQNLGSSK